MFKAVLDTENKPKDTKHIQDPEPESERRSPLCREASPLCREATPLQQGDGPFCAYLKSKKRVPKVTKCKSNASKYKYTSNT